MNTRIYFKVLRRKKNWYLIHNLVTNVYMIAYHFDINTATYKNIKYNFKDFETANEYFDQL